MDIYNNKLNNYQNFNKNKNKMNKLMNNKLPFNKKLSIHLHLIYIKLKIHLCNQL